MIISITVSLIKLLVCTILLIWAVVEDLTFFRISNRLIIAGLILSVIFLFIEDVKGECVSQYILGGVITFVLTFLFYLIGGIGAGDVKLFAIVGLFIGADYVANFLLYTAFIALIIGIVEIKKGKFHCSIAIALGYFCAFI